MLISKKYSGIFLFLIIAFAAQAQELKLWYKQPAVQWTEALPIGNGRLGAMIHGGVLDDHIQFNEETLWNGSPRAYNDPNAHQYLDTIRQLLFNGKQKEAEDLAALHFMGLKSDAGNRDKWMQSMLNLEGMHGNPAAFDFDDSQWKTMQVPSYEGWEAVGFEGLDGAVWFRTSFVLPEAWNGKDIMLDLNRIRNYDRTFVNGKQVGTMDTDEARQYRVPAATLKAGKNSIAIQVINFFDKGGIAGYKDTTRAIGIFPEGQPEKKLSIHGRWRYFIQNNEPPPVGTFQASYQPFGDLHLKFNHTAAISDYRRELDLSEAISTTTYRTEGVTYSRSYFASTPHQSLVVHLNADKKASINVHALLSSAHKKHSVKKINNNTVSLAVKVINGALHGTAYLQVQAKGGNITVDERGLNIEHADEATFYLTAATNFVTYNDVSGKPDIICKEQIQKIEGNSYATIKAHHIKEYRNFFNTFSIRLGIEEDAKRTNLLPTNERLAAFATTYDPAFAALYVQYGRYLLISASRPGTRPANLQGIWNNLLAPPWGSKYTTNINAEMNYWPAELLNLSPMHQPFFDMTKELAQTGKETAKAYYNADGWVLHHNTDLWRGTAPINASNHGIWVTGGAWLCQHLWEHYLFTQDKKFLAETAYPLMKQSAMFFNDFLIKDPVTGYLISTPSNSPENGGLVAGPTMDHQIIRSLFQNVINATKILNLDASIRATLVEKLSQIAPNKIGRLGQLQEWMQDIDDSTNKHRHISHLWGMYPGSEINYDETPELMQAAKQSLLFRGDAATGWSLGWKINCWARFLDGEHAYTMIKMLLSPAKGGAGSYPNLFDAHPPFQIDGNFGGAAGIGELLVQSHVSTIDILPALPAAFAEGSVKGLCARGGFELDMQWSKGKLVQLRILSKAGNDVKLRYNGQIISIKTKANTAYTFNGSLKSI